MADENGLRWAQHNPKTSYAPGPGHCDNKAAHVTQVPNSARADQTEQHDVRLLALKPIHRLNSTRHA